jgi:hypothetical protein
MERDNYTTMTPQEMLAKLMHHEVLDDEAKEASVLKKSIALTASHGSESSHCNKGCCEHRHNNDDDDLDEKQALLVGNYKKYLRMKKETMMRYGGNKPYKKRFFYECGDTAHLAADCPNKVKKSRYNKQEDKKRGEAHLGQEWQSDSDSDDDNDNEKKSVAAIAIQETSSSTKSSPTMLHQHLSSPTLLHHLDSSPTSPTTTMMLLIALWH